MGIGFHQLLVASFSEGNSVKIGSIKKRNIFPKLVFTFRYGVYKFAIVFGS